jgi:long-chain acyl-CoA synthetase
MNAFDYFFSYSKNLSRDFVLGTGEEASFNEIYNDSLQVARYLKNKLGEGQNILLISSNSRFFIKAYLSIIKSGNICVPINPSTEQSNLNYIITTTSCNQIFLSSKTKLPYEISVSNIISESDLEEIIKLKDRSFEAFPEYFDDSRTAEIIFTSGSTGLPKGVVLSHLNIASNTDSIIKFLKLTPSDIIGVVLPFYYCYGLSLLHTHLKVGGGLVLINNFIFLGTVINDLKKYKCTGFAGVPSHFQILLRKSQTFSTTEFPDLKYVTQAGGKLHDIFIKEFIEAFPEILFFVMYGQTEATARLAYLPPELLIEKMGSIGKEIPGVSLKILNKDHIPVQVGDVGEIAAKGNNIMKGYYNDSDASDLALKDGWLLTGDLGKMDDDGFIYLVGRKKEIIKVGGRRVSPKEIEKVILSVNEVIDCVVEGIYDEILGEGIQAKVVIIDGCERIKVKEDILKKCNETLALFKIPQRISFENSIQMNSAGKKLKTNPVNR